MKWWTDLWLYEGFTTYLQYLGVDHYNPKWKIMDQLIIDKTQPAMALDALVSSHPINIAVHDPYDISSIFDTISYSKVRNSTISTYKVEVTNIFAGDSHYTYDM